MQVFNITKKRSVAAEVRAARNLVSQFIGLIGRKEFRPGEGLWLPMCNGVHAFFLRFPIDVVFLDSNFQVVAFVRDLMPWRATNFILKAKSALELPAGTISASGIEVGDRLKLMESQDEISAVP